MYLTDAKQLHNYAIAITSPFLIPILKSFINLIKYPTATANIYSKEIYKYLPLRQAALLKLVVNYLGLISVKRNDS